MTNKQKLDAVRIYCLSSDCIPLHKVQYRNLRASLVLEGDSEHLTELIEIFYQQIKSEGGVDE